MFDVFEAELRCPSCNAVALESDNTAMQTNIRGADGDGTALRVGFAFDRLDLVTDAILRRGYLLVATPELSRPIRLLDVWICPSCATEQWAMVTIEAERIRDIRAVHLNQTTLAASNFISHINAELLARTFAVGGLDTVENLRRNLPK